MCMSRAVSYIVGDKNETLWMKTKKSLLYVRVPCMSNDKYNAHTTRLNVWGENFFMMQKKYIYRLLVDDSRVLNQEKERKSAV